MNISVTLKELLKPILRQISMENPQGYKLEAPHEGEYINRASIYFPSSWEADSNIPVPVQYLLRQANEVQPGPVAFRIEKNELPCDACDFCIDAPARYGRYLMAECDETVKEDAVRAYLGQLDISLRLGRMRGWNNNAECPMSAGELWTQFLAPEDETIDRALSQWAQGILPLRSVAGMPSRPGDEPVNTRLLLRLVIAINAMVTQEPWFKLPELKGELRRLADLIERQEVPAPGVQLPQGSKKGN